MSYSQLQQVSALNKLNAGLSKSILEGQQGSPMELLLKSIAQELVNDFRDAMDARGIGASDNLKQSLKPDSTVKIDGDVVSIGVKADHYWKFVNFGVNGEEVNRGAPAWGTQPIQDKSFHQSIIEWIPFAGLQLNERFETYDALAWAVMRSIKRKGKQGRPFYGDVVNQKLVKELAKPISALIGRAIQVKIVAPWQ